MCVIIEKPEGVLLNLDIYEECFRMHGDGVGIAYVDSEKNQLVIEKGFMDKKLAIEAILKHEQKHLLIHFRKVSRGPVNPENCHPFWAESNIKGGDDFTDENPRFQFAIAHNGTFNITPIAGKSDTSSLMELVITPWLSRDPWLFDHHYSRFIWEGYADKGYGQKNKMVIFKYDRLEKKLSVEFVYKKEGMTYNSCWFSNHSWIPMGPKWSHVRGTTTTTTNYGYNHCGTHGSNVGNGQTAGSTACGGKDDKVKSFINIDVIVEGIPLVSDVGWGEQFPDHLGWCWHKVDGFFYNAITGGKLEKLTYREANEDEYKYHDKPFKRTNNPSLKQLADSRFEELTQKKSTCSGKSQGSQQLCLGSAVNPVSEANKAINVPRDYDVNEGDAWEKSIELARGASSGKTSHLHKKDRKKITRIACDFVRETYGEQIKRDCPPNMCIAIMRNDFLEAFPFSKSWTLLQIDQHIIARGGFTQEDVKRGIKAYEAENAEAGGDLTGESGIGYN